VGFPLDVTTQLLLDGAWTTITDDVYQRDPITIFRGRADEASNVDPSWCKLTLKNKNGPYSPRNPNSPYFGALGRNTELRILTPGSEDHYLALPGNAVSYVTTPDTSTLDTPGDLDIRLEIEPESWRPPTLVTLARKADTDTQMSWFLFLTTAGNLVLAWSSDGAGTGYLTRTSTVPIPATSGRLAVRAVLDVNNGAAGHDVKFYTAPTLDGVATNLLTEAQANFESGTGGWVGAGTPAPTVSQDTIHQKYGTKSLKTLWNGSGTFPQSQLTLSGFTTSAPYAMGAWLYVPTGSPDTRIVAGSATSPLTAVKDELVWLSLPFTAPGTTPTIGVRSSGSPSGQACWTDGVTVVDGSTAVEYSKCWAQLGTTITTAGTTSVFASTSTVLLGINLQAKVYVFELRTTIAGTPVASPDFGAAESGATTVVDAQGLVWTLVGNAVMVNPNARFHGAVSAWPQRWSEDEADVWVPIQADGILRRLGQGASALKSTLYRGLTTAGNVVAYWPFEDGDVATELASALPGQSPMVINPTVGTAVQLATFDGFKASSPLPAGSGAIFSADVADYPLAIPTKVQTRMLMYVPAAVPADGVALRVFTSGTAGRWDLKVNVGGSMSLITYDTDGNQINDSGAFGFAVNGKLLRVSLELERVGTAVNYTIVTLQVGQSTGSVGSGSIASQSLGKCTRVVVNSARFADVVYGHVSVHNEITSIFDLSSELNAWTGEQATNRVLRLCREEGLPVSLIGDASDSVTMGYQLPKTLLDLLRECADADLGILHEPRGYLGLAYRTRHSLYAQDATLALVYTRKDMSSIEPTEDDQTTRNDVTVARVGGSSARAELTTGPLSTLPPPDGVGRYDESVSVNTDLDSALPDQAGWRLHLGTVDEPRYPVLGISLSTDSFADDAALTAAAQALDLGDKITVSNPPAWLPPDQISQMSQGFLETLQRYLWEIAVNCSPASPWDVAIWDQASGPGEARYSSDGSSLAAGATSTATSLSVATPSGPLWGHADGDFDIYVAGERMTVTAVSGASSPQTFTVVRSVNGVVKAQASGAEVRLFKPAVWAL